VKEATSGSGATTFSLAGDSLSAAGFDKTECEIMYPPFVESGLVAPLERSDD
jgi:hypothetical protein